MGKFIEYTFQNIAHHSRKKIIIGHFLRGVEQTHPTVTHQPLNLDTRKLQHNYKF